MLKKIVPILSACAFCSITLLAPVNGAEINKKTKTAGVTELNIVWGEWAPAGYLQQIGALYETQTGIKVNIIQRHWTTFTTDFFSGMEAHSTTWDMVVGDSQWLGLQKRSF